MQYPINEKELLDLDKMLRDYFSYITNDPSVSALSRAKIIKALQGFINWAHTGDPNTKPNWDRIKHGIK